MTPSSGPVSLLEQLPELRGTFYVTDRQFIVKGYNLRIVRQKRYTGQGMWEEGGRVPMPWDVPLSPTPACLPYLEAHQTTSFGGFLGASKCGSE